MGIPRIIMVRKAEAVAGLEPPCIRVKALLLPADVDGLISLNGHDGNSFLPCLDTGPRICSSRFPYKARGRENKTAPYGTLGTDWILLVNRSSHGETSHLSGRGHCSADRRPI